MASAVAQPPHQYASSPASSSLPPSLITNRPILPLPKRRVRSLTLSSSSAITSNSAPRLLPPQIFSHTCPPTTNQNTPPYVQTQGDYESSDSDEEGDDAGSTASSIGREDFNLKNKKKRKIPLSATASANVGVAVTDIGTPVNGNRIGGPWKGRLSGWRIPSATSRTEGGYLRRKARAVSRTYCDDETENPASQKKNEEATENKGSESSSPPPSGPFSFTCASPLTLPIVPAAPAGVQGNQDNTSAPPNAPLPVPPPPPPPIVQENTHQQQYVQQGQPQPQQPQPTQTGSQPPPQRLPPQGIKHPNSEKARRVAQLTKLRERYRTGPKPDSDEIYICQFCTYGFIYGEQPTYLVRQYNRKRNAEIRLRRERRKMLEKARMKGKKGAATNSQTNSAGTEDFDDAEVCCTCGQQVGQHNHVNNTAGGTAPPVTQQGSTQVHGPGRAK